MSSKPGSIEPLPVFLQAIEQNGGEVYEVGGSLRDALLGLPHKDRDLLVTGLPMDQLIILLSRFGAVQQVGKSFGVIKFKPKHANHEFDIALPRQERSTGQGHRDFEVTFDPFLPVEKDLARRDFTLNALARRLKTGEIFDPFGGQADLKLGLLRQVFPQAFEEDPLRMLRAIQFAARINLKIEPKTFSALKKHAPLILTVSAERIIEELRKLFLAQKPSYGFRLMQQSGLLELLFPELFSFPPEDPAQKHKTLLEQNSLLENGTPCLSFSETTLETIDAARSSQNLKFRGDLELMLAALFHKSRCITAKNQRSQNADQKKHRTKLRSESTYAKWRQRYPVAMWGIDPNAVDRLLQHQNLWTVRTNSETELRFLIYHIGQDLILKAIDLNIAICESEQNNIQTLIELRNKIESVLAKRPPLSLADLAVNGQTLIDWGVPKGPQIGAFLKKLLEHVIADPSKNEPSLLKNWFQKHSQSNPN